MRELFFSYRPLAKLLELFDLYTPFTGIDFGSSAIKLVVADRRGKQAMVRHISLVETPEGAVVDRTPANADLLIDALREPVKALQKVSRHAVVSVSGEHAILRVLPLSADLSPLELEDQIYQEAERFLPASIEEVYLDYQPLGPSPENPRAVDYLVAAARRETVDRYLEVVEGIGLEPVIVEVEGYALLRGLSLPSEQLQGQVAILDLGDAATSLYFFSQERPRFYRSQRIGGRSLLEKLEESQNLSKKEALGEMRRAKEWSEERCKELLFPFFQELIQQIRLMAQALPDVSFDKIYITGGLTALPGILQVLEKGLQKKIIFSEPFKQAILDPNFTHFESKAPCFTQAAGLAYRCLEFDGAH